MDARQPAAPAAALTAALTAARDRALDLMEFPTIAGASPLAGPPRARSAARASRQRGAPARARPRGEMQLHVARLLRSALMAGQFVPGQTLSLRQLAQQLGTSPMPVRGALTQLIASGVLEIQPSGSVAVAGMTPSRFAELSGVRKALEGMAAEMACRNATPQLVARLERVNAQLQRAIGRRDVLACLRLNQAFHFALYSASRSEILPAMIESLWLRAGPFMYFSLAAPATMWDATGHQAVIAALRSGNARATRVAIERDIASSADYLLRRSAAFRQRAADAREPTARRVAARGDTRPAGKAAAARSRPARAAARPR